MRRSRSMRRSWSMCRTKSSKYKCLALRRSTHSVQPHPSSTAYEPHPNLFQPRSSSITKDHLPQQPPAKKSRFSALTEQKLEELTKPCIPKNTESSTKWALDNFHSCTFTVLLAVDTPCIFNMKTCLWLVHYDIAVSAL